MNLTLFFPPCVIIASQFYENIFIHQYLFESCRARDVASFGSLPNPLILIPFAWIVAA